MWDEAKVVLHPQHVIFLYLASIFFDELWYHKRKIMESEQGALSPTEKLKILL